MKKLICQTAREGNKAPETDQTKDCSVSNLCVSQWMRQIHTFVNSAKER